MSGWEDFKTDAGKIASKAAVKAGEVADAATAGIRIQGLKLRLCEKYEKLGRLTYKSQKENSDPTAATAAVIADIDSLRTDIKKIETDIKSRREARSTQEEPAGEQ